MVSARSGLLQLRETSVFGREFVFRLGWKPHAAPISKCDPKPGPHPSYVFFEKARATFFNKGTKQKNSGLKITEERRYFLKLSPVLFRRPIHDPVGHVIGLKAAS